MLEKGVYVIGFFYLWGAARHRRFDPVSATYSRRFGIPVNAFAETNEELRASS